jgi:hypothetical protein
VGTFFALSTTLFFKKMGRVLLEEPYVEAGPGARWVREQGPVKMTPEFASEEGYVSN